MVQLLHLGKSKPRGKESEVLIAEISRLESALHVARDDQKANKTRLSGIKDELKHVEREIRALQPDLRKAQTAYDSVKGKIDAPAAVINEAEDGIFEEFCEELGVANIRDIQFDEQQLRVTEERLKPYEDIIKFEGENLAKLEDEKTAAQEEIAEAEEAIQTLQDDLKALAEELEEKTKKNDEIEKLGLERSAIYRKCRLDEIKLPLLTGNLKNVPMEENPREEVAMNVDEDEEGTQQVKRVSDFGIEVEFDSLDEDEREDGSAKALKELDESISKVNAEIEHMAPNLKVIDRDERAIIGALWNTALEHPALESQHAVTSIVDLDVRPPDSTWHLSHCAALVL
ncbi:Structural maintenance of chromosomes protein 1 [Trametes pubescens]|uniref:Structural maintenance of chromosomes protein 1 n=1 Tax=Trametes pubescens TaxID=154538 RepID=A0A1M2W3E6_TRAPU|nr:Structural maintenance of chromosomes protein 1 [Trametes pubescens]